VQAQKLGFGVGQTLFAEARRIGFGRVRGRSRSGFEPRADVEARPWIVAQTEGLGFDGAIRARRREIDDAPGDPGRKEPDDERIPALTQIQQPTLSGLSFDLARQD
jgi:hypothetical protein